MILSDLTLQNFRSYTKRSFNFSPVITLVIGPNASGKTNIIEAIYLLATGKSFRAERDSDMVSWGSQVARAKAELSDNMLEIVLTGGTIEGHRVPTKKYLVGGVARRMIDFVGHLPAVLFWPEDLELVTDSPSRRRRYLDSVLTQVDREYRRNLMSYERGLRQRNRLLDLVNEGKAARQQLLFWNQLLIKAGGYLTDKRAQFIDFINTTKLSSISYSISYDKSVISESRLAQYADEEVAAKATLVGPHRDDFSFDMIYQGQARNLTSYGSRGEQRLGVLWLKLAELTYIERTTHNRPILLLDDIFSELDREHRQLVRQLVLEQQTVITSSDEQVETLVAGGRRQGMAIIRLPSV